MTSIKKREALITELVMFWGRQLNQWPHETIQNNITNRQTLPPLPQLKLDKYPVSDQKAVLNKTIRDLFGPRWEKPSMSLRLRYDIARHFFREGSTHSQRILVSLLTIFFEPLIPLLWLSGFVLALLIRLVLQTGVRLPLLWLINFAVSGSGIHGRESLPPGENGYTKVFRGGSEPDLDELEVEFMTRNRDSLQDDKNANVSTVSISYKHYANKGIVPGDDHRICRTDLQAIAKLIKAAGPCNLRFWIDSKLPPTRDSTFERWLNRGVRPYGRYVTFLCPSAQQNVQASFWLANEYHFASAGKGTIYIEGDQIFYDLRYGYDIDFHRRLLHVIIEAERHPVQVRDEDKGKVIHWATCCLKAEQDKSVRSLSPPVDNMTMTEEDAHQIRLMWKIRDIIRTYGPQELPVPPGRSWNKKNPLLLAGTPHQQLDLSSWYGMSLDESPRIVYFIYNILDIAFDKVAVLEVTLDRAHFTPGRIRVVRKVLKELSSSVIMRCKLVAVPLLCDWE